MIAKRTLKITRNKVATLALMVAFISNIGCYSNDGLDTPYNNSIRRKINREFNEIRKKGNSTASKEEVFSILEKVMPKKSLNSNNCIGLMQALSAIGMRDIIKELIDKFGADICYKKKPSLFAFETSLHEAAYYGQLDTLKMLFEEYGMKDFYDKENGSVLMATLCIYPYYISKNLKRNFWFGNSNLITIDHLETANYILDHSEEFGTNITALDSEQRSALSLALQAYSENEDNEYKEKYRKLINKLILLISKSDKNILTQLDMQGYTPLTIAIENEDAESVKEILKHLDKFDVSVLNLAAFYGNENIIKLLLKKSSLKQRISTINYIIQCDLYTTPKIIDILMPRNFRYPLKNKKYKSQSKKLYSKILDSYIRCGNIDCMRDALSKGAEISDYSLSYAIDSRNIFVIEKVINEILSTWNNWRKYFKYIKKYKSELFSLSINLFSSVYKKESTTAHSIINILLDKKLDKYSWYTAFPGMDMGPFRHVLECYKTNSDYEKLIRSFIEKREKYVNEKDYNGKTPLYLALERMYKNRGNYKSDMGIIKSLPVFLVKKGADPFECGAINFTNNPNLQCFKDVFYENRSWRKNRSNWSNFRNSY